MEDQYTDRYLKDSENYNRLMDEINANYGETALDPEYNNLIQNNLLNLTIKLARYKFAFRLLKETDRVLDVGCSSGMGTIFLGQGCVEVTGLDVKEVDINKAKALNERENVSFIAEDLFTYNPEKNMLLLV